MTPIRLGAAKLFVAAACLAAALPLVGTTARRQTAGALPSWNDGPSKKAIVGFVDRVTREGGPDFVPVPARIAVFDNDGTLWSEQPIYFQVAFAFDRVKALAPQHPDWKDRQPFKGVLEGDMKAVAASGEKGLLELIAVTHVGNTTEEFETIVTNWIASARHPKSGRPYTEMVFQPMLELLAYLRANGFKTFIVSGGGVEFMRPWTERVYGIPPEQVVGSRAKVKYELRNGVPVLVRLAEIDLVDDKAGKPVGIHQVIGRRPIVAFGNSDGDFEMLEWTTSGAGPRLGAIVHHTDAEREWAYDRTSPVGQLARGLDEAAKRGWVLVDMKQDWNAIYPPAR
jgi:phosphoglycolate phosphatase-like HAD superfamily hydrolase